MTRSANKTFRRKQASVQLLRGRKNGVEALVISPDSRFVVAASMFAQCHVWDLSDAKPKSRLLYVRAIVPKTMAFVTPTALVGYDTSHWTRYDLADRSEVTLARPVTTHAANDILHPSGNLLKSLSYEVPDGDADFEDEDVEANLTTYRLTAGGFEPIEPVKGDTNLSHLLSFDPSGGRYLALNDRVVESSSGYHLRDAATDDVVVVFQDSREMSANSNSPHRWAFTPDGRLVFAVNCQSIAAYDCDAGGPPILEFPAAPGSEFTALAVHPGGRILATVEDERTVTLRDADTLQPLRSYDFAMPKVTCVAFTPDGTRCAVGNSRGKVLLFDVE